MLCIVLFADDTSLVFSLEEHINESCVILEALNTLEKLFRLYNLLINGENKNYQIQLY